MTLPAYFPKTSSWKNYKRQLLKLELIGASKEDINFYIRDSVKKSFYAYSEYVSRESNTLPALDPNAYDILSTAFEKVASGDYPVLLISLPPRSGKSTLCSHLISWLHAKDPSVEHILLSYNSRVAELGSQKVEKLKDSSTFKSLFPTPEEQELKLRSIGRGSALCGHSYGGYSDVPGLLLMDDYDSYHPFRDKEEDQNKAALTHIMNRCIGKRAIVCIGSRKGENDTFEFLLNEFGHYDPNTNPSGAVHLNFSVIVESEVEKQVDPLNRDIGEVLSGNPTYHPKNLDDLRKLCGEENFSWIYKGRAPEIHSSPFEDGNQQLEKVAVSVSPYSSESGDMFGLCVSGLRKETGSIHVLEAFEIQGDLSTLNSVLNLISKLYDTKCVVVEDNPDHFNLVEYLDCKGYAISKVRIKPGPQCEEVPHSANFMAWRFLSEAKMQAKVQEYFCDSQPR